MPNPPRNRTSPEEQQAPLAAAERSNARRLTTIAAGLLVAAIVGIAVSTTFWFGDGEPAADWLAQAAGIVAVVALAFAIRGGWRRQRHHIRVTSLLRSAGALVAALLLGVASLAVEQIDGRSGRANPDDESAAKIDRPLDGLSDADLAQRFRPLLLFDSGERWRPLDAERFLAEGIHRACLPKALPCARVREADGLGALTGPANRLRVNGRVDLKPGAYGSKDATCRQDRLLDCDSGEAARIYYHVTHRGARAYIDYWWLLRFNDAPLGGKFDHQSDWEGVVVAVDERRFPPTFDWVGFAAHEGVWRYFRETLRCEGDPRPGSCGTASESRHGDRVNVYVAKGTHAAYPVPCAATGVVRLCEQNKRVPFALLSRFRVPEAGFDGRAPWGSNDEPAALAPFPERAWVQWPGRWDYTGHVQSPARQHRYAAPDNVTAGDCPRRVCSAKPPPGYQAACFGWFGPNAVATACDSSTLRKAAALGPAPFSLRRGRMEDDAFVADVGDATSAGSPGVAQLLGTYLLRGEAIRVQGPTPPATELYVRIRRGDAVAEARFTGVRLESGESALIRPVARSRGDVTAELRRSDGRTAEPSAVITLAGATG